jgi:hypothetical protein
MAKSCARADLLSSRDLQLQRCIEAWTLQMRGSPKYVADRRRFEGNDPLTPEPVSVGGFHYRHEVVGRANDGR